MNGGHSKKMLADLLPGSILFIAMSSIVFMVWGKLKSHASFIYAGWILLNLELLTLFSMIIGEILNVSAETIVIMDIILILPMASFCIVKWGKKLFIKIIGFTLLNMELLAMFFIFYKKIFHG